MSAFRDWCDQPIELARSSGGVLAVADPFTAVVRGGVDPWPPPELVQKGYQSRLVSAYEGSDRQFVTRRRGFYSDLQSLHSEDTMTWSVFGPLAYAEPPIRAGYFNALLREASVPAPPAERATIALWRRLPHPDTLVPGGPEIDVLLQSARTLVLVEAKWRSSVGRQQGKLKNKDQLTLRTEFITKYGACFYPGVTQFVVLGAYLNRSVLSPEERPVNGGSLFMRELSWEKLVRLQPHPASDELPAYFDWRCRHSQPS